ncbi:hypothetical protein OOT46_07590 [Aquabacterium sp. A7-Y]|uniref:hypothetical protein n=1 Tax=Aquabacterium sp. A7-Y TaxID=1349605 RepID=UPI00223DA619|nr:hypothetical protein [Aquabacterium sp. A7-Y]MCW7537712.1 hypothetical protein [Aquabacterium sp. A7-Y]
MKVELLARAAHGVSSMLRALFAVCLFALALVMFVNSLKSSAEALNMLFAYDEVTGVVVSVDRTQRRARVTYLDSYGEQKWLATSDGGKRFHREVGTKVAVLVPAYGAGLYDGTEGKLKDDLSVAGTGFMITVLAVFGGMLVWPRSPAPADTPPSSFNRWEKHGIVGDRKSPPQDPARQAQLQASIELEIAERLAAKKSKGRKRPVSSD